MSVPSLVRDAVFVGCGGMESFWDVDIGWWKVFGDTLGDVEKEEKDDDDDDEDEEGEEEDEGKRGDETTGEVD